VPLEAPTSPIDAATRTRLAHARTELYERAYVEAAGPRHAATPARWWLIWPEPFLFTYASGVSEGIHPIAWGSGVGAPDTPWSGVMSLSVALAAAVVAVDVVKTTGGGCWSATRSGIGSARWIFR
jgi:hypothetical protein